MITHPYSTLSRAELALATTLVASAWALLTLILVWAVPADHVEQIRALASAPTLSAAQAQLAAWEPAVTSSFSFLLGFDFLYDVVHNNAAALLVVWGAARLSIRSAVWTGNAAAWLLWFDTALNLFENVAFMHILRAGPSEPLLPLASAVFSFRSLTLGMALVVGTGFHIAAWRRG